MTRSQEQLDVASGPRGGATRLASWPALVPIGRFVALAVALPTFGILFVNDGFRSDNLFLVPDLALCAMLAVGALLPRPYAIGLLTLGFGFGAGVISTAVFSYVVRGALADGVLTVLAAVACLVMAVLFAAASGVAMSGATTSAKPSAVR